MGIKYDEYLEENPFFQEIQESHKDLLEKASFENWVICIPRVGTVKRTSITIEDILEHVLIPNPEHLEKRYTSMNKRTVSVRNNLIILQNDMNYYNSIQILFKETFYVDKLKFKLWCIEYPLNQSFTINDPGNLTSIINIRDCIHLLCVETSGREVLEQISSAVENFLEENKDLELLPLISQKTLIENLYRHCLELCLSSQMLRQKANASAILLEKIYLAVETYMQNCLQNYLFNGICTYVSKRDADLNKAIRNLQDLQLKDFAIHNKFYDNIPSAKYELNRINNYYTVLGKVNCLKRTFNILSDRENDLTLSADDLLQIFVFLIIKVNVNNWTANVTFLNEFRFSSLNSTDESSFLITTLEAAVEYIRSGNLFKELKPRADHFYIEIEWQAENKSPNKSNLERLFEEIRIGNLQGVKFLIIKKREIENKLRVKKKNCHPLCSCDKCESVNRDAEVCTVGSIDDRGRTALHIACVYGHPSIVDFLISEGSNLNSLDTSGSTPLHYAVLRGHQHAAFLLLHAGAEMNIQDGDGNTPLHLATNNGHENCVKALVYYSENSCRKINIDSGNKQGNTPLHLASRWGYINIIQVLLQFEAQVDVTNVKKQKPVDIAHNCFVKRMLITAESEQKQKVNISDYETTIHLRESQELEMAQIPEECETQGGHNFGVRPKNIQETKKCELLLKAIEKNDLPLTRYYLGMPERRSTDPSVDRSKCHPLCACDQCNLTLENVNQPIEKEKVNINLCNIDGYTALHVAAKFGRVEILRLLLDSGALINVKTYKTRYNVFHIACLYNHIKIVQEILECGGSNIDVQDSLGNTPLHYAAMQANEKMVEFLLKKGADINIKNLDNKTPFQEAEDRSFYSIVKVLKGYHNQEFSKDHRMRYLD